MICRARDKNNTNINLERMRRFRLALEHCEVREIHLQNRKFTWSNERQRPTMVKLDGCFCNESWDLAFPQHILHALPTGPSDQCPLLLSSASRPQRPHQFKFENFWVKIPGFKDIIATEWNRQTMHTEPMHRLNHKLQIIAKSLMEWSRGICTEAKLQFHMALGDIQRLDVAQEHRNLTVQEFRLSAGLKRRLLGLATIERARKRQASRITFIRKGDASTFFLSQSKRLSKKEQHSEATQRYWMGYHSR